MCLIGVAIACAQMSVAVQDAAAMNNCSIGDARPSQPARLDWRVGALLVSVICLMLFEAYRKSRRQRVRARSAVAGAVDSVAIASGSWFSAQLCWFRECVWSDELGVRLTPQEVERIESARVRLEALRKLPSECARPPPASALCPVRALRTGPRDAAGSPLLALSPEILFNILNHLSAADVSALSLVCRRLREVCADSYLWRQMAAKRYGLDQVLDLEARCAAAECFIPPQLRHWRTVYALNDVVSAAGVTIRRSVFNAVVSDEPAEPELAASRPTGGAMRSLLSHFGGEPLLIDQDEGLHPRCSRCAREMSLFVQLDLQALPQPLAARFGMDALMQLFVCTGEGSRETACDSSEPFSGASLVRLVPRSANGVRMPPSPPPPSAPAAAPAGADGAVAAASDGDLAVPGPRVFARLFIVDWEAFLEDIGEYWHGGIFRPDVGYYDFAASALPLLRAERELVFPRLAITPKAVIIRKRHPAERARGLHFDPAESRPEELIVKTISLGDKLGGWPAAAPGLAYPECPLCGQPMERMMLQLCSHHHVAWMLGACGVGQVLQCEQHREQLVFRWSVP